MKKEKLTLKELQVASFTTTASLKETGGGDLVRTNFGCAPTEPLHNTCGDSMNYSECRDMDTNCIYK